MHLEYKQYTIFTTLIIFFFFNTEAGEELRVQIFHFDDSGDDLIYKGSEILPPNANHSNSSATAYSLNFLNEKISLSFNVTVKIFCDDGYLVPDCVVKCLPLNTTAGHCDCDYENGKKVCLPGWYRESENCTKYCLPEDDQYGHYDCSQTGDKVCLGN